MRTLIVRQLEKKNSAIWVVALLLVVGVCATGSTETYWVDGGVGASGSGTQSSPWKTFADISWSTVASNLPATIYISGGSTSQTYDQQLNIGASGTSQLNNITVKRPTELEWPGHSGIVRLRHSSDNPLVIAGRSYIIIDGFDISSSNGNLAVFIRSNASYITIQNCDIHDYSSFGLAGYQASHVTIRNNQIRDPDPLTGDDPVQIGPVDNWTFEYNTIKARFPTGAGQHFDGVQLNEPCSDLTFRYNVFGNANNAMIYIETLWPMNNIQIYGNIFNIFPDPNMGSSDWLWAIVVDGNIDAAELYIYNNTFINLNNNSAEHGRAIMLDSGHPNNKAIIENNIFYNSSVEISSNWGGSDSNTVLEFNCYFEPGGGSVIRWADTEYSGVPFTPAGGSQKETGGIVSDPLLSNVSSVSSSNPDAHLTSLSPCIGAGVNVGLSFDFEGNPFLNPPSMGVYEAGGGAIPRPSSPSGLRVIN